MSGGAVDNAGSDRADREFQMESLGVERGQRLARGLVELGAVGVVAVIVAPLPDLPSRQWRIGADGAMRLLRTEEVERPDAFLVGVPPTPLSERHWAVLRGALRGERGEDTAARLGVSAKQVEWLRERAMRVLGARSTIHAVGIALGLSEGTR